MKIQNNIKMMIQAYNKMMTLDNIPIIKDKITIILLQIRITKTKTPIKDIIIRIRISKIHIQMNTNNKTRINNRIIIQDNKIINNMMIVINKNIILNSLIKFILLQKIINKVQNNNCQISRKWLIFHLKGNHTIILILLMVQIKTKKKMISPKKN